MGEYIEADWDDTVTNTMKAWTYPVILLGPTGNIQGTVKALDLQTGEVKKLRTFTLYPMPDQVINLVNEMGRKDMERDLGSRMTRLEFRNRLNERFEWDNDDLGEIDSSDLGPTIAHADTPANHPGITFESEALEDGAMDKVLRNENQQSHESTLNTGFSSGNDALTTGVSPDVVIWMT